MFSALINFFFADSTNFKFKQFLLLVVIGLLSFIGILCKENAIMIMVSCARFFRISRF